MRELDKVFDVVQGRGAKVSLIIERDGRYYQAKYDRLSRSLTIGMCLNWDYWRDIIEGIGVKHLKFTFHNMPLNVYVEADRSVLCDLD